MNECKKCRGFTISIHAGWAFHQGRRGDIIRTSCLECRFEELLCPILSSRDDSAPGTASSLCVTGGAVTKPRLFLLSADTTPSVAAASAVQESLSVIE